MEPIDAVRDMLKEYVADPDVPFMERRKQADKFAASFAAPDDISIRAGELSGIPVEWVEPDNCHPTHLFFHLHGGGYVMGNPAGSRALTSEIARLARCKVVSVDYRLAPEHPFPAAIDDSVDAYGALLSNGHNPGDIAVGGESAGGGLALGMLVKARNSGLAMPACAALVSPWTDMSCNAESFRVNSAVDPLLTSKSLKQMADAYLAGSAPRSPLASPLFAQLKGFPPVLMQVGSEEVLLDDSRRLAEKMQAEGATVDLEIWPQMIHVWHMFHRVLPEGAQAIQAMADFLLSHWKA